MPKVGKKHFAYTESGKKAAKEESKKTGKPIEHMARPKKPMKTKGRKKMMGGDEFGMHNYGK